MRGSAIVVYRDPNFTSGWISHHQADVIQAGANRIGFQTVDASGLKSWMESRIGIQGTSIVVFSQDVVPDRLMEPPDAGCLLRQYLDSGGSVLWMGDIPCFYPGKPGKPTLGDLDDGDKSWFTNSGFARILSVLPVVADPLHPVRILGRGKEIGLERPWSGMRPIIKDKSIEVLASGTCLVASEIIGVRRSSIWRSIAQRISKVEVGTTGGSVEFSAPKNPAADPLANRRTFYQNYPSAWFKHFGGPGEAGFYRIWDCGFKIPDKLFSVEIQRVASLICGRLGMRYVNAGKASVAPT